MLLLVVVVVVLMFVAVVVVVGAIDDVAVVVVAAAVVVVVFIAWIASSRGNRGEMATQCALHTMVAPGAQRYSQHRLGRCRRHRDAAAVADVTVVAAVVVCFCCRAQRPLATGQPPSLAAT